MTAKTPMRVIAGSALSALFGCGYFYPTNVNLEHGYEWRIPGKRDFRLDAGIYALPKRDTTEEVQESLREILEREIEREGLCPHGYTITGYGGYEGGYRHIEGLCNDESASEVLEQE